MGQMIQILWNNNDDISSTSNQDNEEYFYTLTQHIDIIKLNSEKTICLEKIQLSFNMVRREFAEAIYTSVEEETFRNKDVTNEL